MLLLKRLEEDCKSKWVLIVVFAGVVPEHFAVAVSAFGALVNALCVATALCCCLLATGSHACCRFLLQLVAVVALVLLLWFAAAANLVLLL